MINVALDLVGSATTLLDYAALVEGKGRTADDLAYLRDEMHYRNVMLVEQPNGDFAYTIARQFFYDVYNFYLNTALKSSKDATIAAIAEKSLKEITYHLRHSSEWMIRFGDGTEESKRRVQEAVDDLWMHTGDLFSMNEVDALLIEEGIAVDKTGIRQQWDKMVKELMQRATLTIPENTFMLSGSLEGKHTEHLGFLLAEMQYLPRAYPGAKW